MAWERDFKDFFANTLRTDEEVHFVVRMAFREELINHLEFDQLVSWQNRFRFRHLRLSVTSGNQICYGVSSRKWKNQTASLRWVANSLQL